MEIASPIMHFECNSTLVLIAAAAAAIAIAAAVAAWSVFSAPVIASVLSVHDGIAAFQQQRLDRRAEMVRV